MSPPLRQSWCLLMQHARNTPFGHALGIEYALYPGTSHDVVADLGRDTLRDTLGHVALRHRLGNVFAEQAGRVEQQDDR